MSRVKGVLLLLTLTAVSEAVSTDPCDSPIVLDGVPRQLQVLTNVSFCDKDLTPGWYRFQQGTGEVAMKMVDRNHCGAETTVWMKDKIPLPGKQSDNDFCFNHIQGVNNGCLWSVKTAVKNCGGQYLVYHFPLQSMACPMTVCTDPAIQPCPVGEVSQTGFKPCQKIPCPPSKWSPSGYEPCYDPYPLFNNVTLTPPEKINGLFQHTCHFNSQDMSPDAVFNVTWYMDGKAVKVDQVSNPNREALFELAGWQGHINQKLTCGVMTYYAPREHMTSKEMTSKAYFGGIKIEPSSLTITEGIDKTVQVISTLPVDCGGSVLEAMCRLDLHVISPKLFTTSGCGLALTPASWNSTTHEAKVNVEVTSVVDPAHKPDYHTSLEVHVTEGNTTGYLSMWSNATYVHTKVVIKDGSTKNCVSTGDPHFSQSFCYNRRYNLYHLGDFNFASDMKAPIVVQIETNTYHPTHLPIISALAVQTGDDVTMFDTNGGSKMATVSTFHKPTSHMVQSCGTNEYQVSTPHGHRINVYPRGTASKGFHIDVKLAFPGEVKPVPHQVFMNGTLEQMAIKETCCVQPITDGKHSFGHRGEIVSAVIDKFRVVPNENLFKGNLVKMPKAAEKLYCTCAPGTNGIAVKATCSNSKAKDPLINRPTCKPYHPKIITTPPAQQRPGEHSFKEYQPLEHPWPTPSGITLAQAQGRCRQVILSHVPTQCANMKKISLANAIADCTDDIQASNGFQYVASAAEAFKAMCESEILSNPDNYVNSKPPAIIANECPNMCSLHGACVKGVCRCEAGWSYEDCSVNTGEPFTIATIDDGFTCNTVISDDCFTPILKVENLGNISGCFVDTKFYYHGRPKIIDSSFVVKCDRINAQTVRVNLPTEPSIYAKYYEIELIGANTSQSIGYVVYDGDCQRCSNDFTCFQKENACLIKGVCYLDGERNYADQSQICKPEVNLDSWSSVNSANSIPVTVNNVNLKIG